MDQLIAKGNAWNFSGLGKHEDRFKEGDRGKLTVKMRWGIPNEVIRGIDSAIRKTGVTLTSPVSQSGNTVTVSFKKELWALTIIAAAFAASIVIIALVVAWQLSKLAPMAAVAAGGAILIALAVAVVAVLWFLTRPPGLPAAAPAPLLA